MHFSLPFTARRPTFPKSPALAVLLIGLILFLVLLIRGLNIGPLQTDVIIIRAWFHDVGVSGFSQRYFEANQRHILAGPLIAFVYSLVGESDLAAADQKTDSLVKYPGNP